MGRCGQAIGEQRGDDLTAGPGDRDLRAGDDAEAVEVERVLDSHPAVIESAVVGVPDERWGEAITAVIVVHPDQQLTAETVRRHARERLADYAAERGIKAQPKKTGRGAAKKTETSTKEATR